MYIDTTFTDLWKDFLHRLNWTVKVMNCYWNAIFLVQFRGGEYSSRLRPGSKTFMVFMYSFQKLWLKTSTRNDIQLSKIKFKKFEKINLNYLVTWFTTPSIVRKLQPTIPTTCQTSSFIFSVSKHCTYKVSPKSTRNGSKHCNWQVQLVFIGSCVHWLVPVLL